MSVAADPETHTFPLRTERLKLRPPEPRDAEAIFRLINDWEVVRNLARVPFPYDIETASAWIAGVREELDQGRAWHLLIVGEADGQEVVIGCVGLRLAEGRTGQLGYWIGRRFWGHGVASEAVRRVASWSLAQLPLDRLDAQVATDNAASAAVLRRTGFRETGTAVQEFRARGAHEVRVFEAGRADIFGEVEAGPADAGAKPLLLVAACGLIDSDGRVLLARRPEGKKLAGLWEFPGGKLRPGETPEAALIRELGEELGIDVTAACLAPFAFASHAYEKFHLLMPLYLCRRWNGLVRPLEGQSLAWVRPAKLADYSMPPADRPLVPLLRDFL